ncbi:DUF397 domain-containing protein [Streptomyces sp. NPDC058045]|uniref:DUF397 domain-containing protein n=1 Tax=Streptomyces sp. NPDC058045 TaxID=3346311 RepID=UPI0036E7718C
MQDNDLTFYKSSYSNGAGECIEVAATVAGKAFRDSKDLSVGVAFMSSAGWQAFIESVKEGSLGV